MVRDAEAHSGAVWATRNDPRVTRGGTVAAQAASGRAAAVVQCSERRYVHRGSAARSVPNLSRSLKRRIPYYRQRHCVKPGITGLGADQTQVRRHDGGHRREAGIRFVLHQEPGAGSGRRDHVSHRESNAVIARSAINMKTQLAKLSTASDRTRSCSGRDNRTPHLRDARTHRHARLRSRKAVSRNLRTAFNQAVKRNSDRFPSDFMFQLTSEEAKALRSQICDLREAGKRRTRPPQQVCAIRFHRAWHCDALLGFAQQTRGPNEYSDHSRLHSSARDAHQSQGPRRARGKGGDREPPSRRDDRSTCHRDSTHEEVAVDQTPVRISRGSVFQDRKQSCKTGSSAGSPVPPKSR